MTMVGLMGRSEQFGSGRTGICIVRSKDDERGSPKPYSLVFDSEWPTKQSER